ncbi:MAG: hypothetical protein AAB368_02875, partial [bacterium]
MRTACLLAVLLLAAPAARAAFEKGGLLDEGPRNASLGGCGGAFASDPAGAKGCPASLARLEGMPVLLGMGAATQADLGTFVAGAVATPSVKIGDSGWYQDASGKLSFAFSSTKQITLETGTMTIWHQQGNLRFGTGNDIVIR